jgi:MoaA/NifB/PqqE/SkfB family radical SAM enzyme
VVYPLHLKNSIPMQFRKIYIELTDRCGRNCSFCTPAAKQRGSMSPADFEKILIQVKPFTSQIDYHVMGDPLILENFCEYLDITQTQGFRGELVTSGWFLKRHKMSTLLHPALKQISISLNSYEGKGQQSKKIYADESFSDFLGNSESDSYLTPILDLCREKLKRNKDIFINLRMFDMRNNDNSISSEVLSEDSSAGNQPHSIADSQSSQMEILKKISLFFDFDVVSWMMDSKNTEDFIQLDSRIRLHRKKKFAWPSLNSPKVPGGGCHGLSSHFGILSDGSVVPCCMDGEGIINLGNLHELKLESILESERALAIQNGFARDVATEELCMHCGYRERFLK